MKKMKLAAKISLGFGLLIVLAVGLGGVAVYYMNRGGALHRNHG